MESIEQNGYTLVDFDSLPYPLSESDREVISMYKELAVKREKEISQRRQKLNSDLLSYVANRLKEWGTKKEHITKHHTNTLSTHSPHITQTSPGDYTHQQPLKPVSGIPVRSPPKPHPQYHPQPHPLHQPMVQRRPPPTSVGHSIPAEPRPSFTRWSKPQYVPPCDPPGTRYGDPLCCVGAVIKGYLTRRLFRCEKIQDIVSTIKDAELVLQSLDSPSTMQEFDLQQRIINQLHTAKHKIHSIFFDLSPKDKMAYITHSRNLRKEKQLRKIELQRMTRTRLSTATLKSIERKKKQLTQAPTVSVLSRKKVTSKPVSNKNSTQVVTRSESRRKTTVSSNKTQETKQRGVSTEKRVVRPHPSNKPSAQSNPGEMKKNSGTKTPQNQQVRRTLSSSKIPPPSSGKFQGKRSSKHKA